MDIYHYHPETGEYMGSGPASNSPLEEGVHLIAANATATAPPVANPGFAHVFDGTKWNQIEDRRGETWWSADGAAVIIKDLGDPTLAGLVATEPAPPPPSTDPADYPLNPFQFFTFLEQIGLSETAVDAAIDQVTADTGKRIEHKRRFRHATSYRRDHPLLVSLVSAVGKTPAQIDIAWLVAKDLT